MKASNEFLAWPAKVEQDGDDLVLLCDPSMLKELGFKDGDVLLFSKEPSSNTVTISTTK